MSIETYTRIDMHICRDLENRGKIRVVKWAEGWEKDVSSFPAKITINDSMTLDDMVAWLENDGWTVRRWIFGARAWKGSIHPIRTAYEIKRLRESLERRKREGEAELQEVELHGIDLAYSF